MLKFYYNPRSPMSRIVWVTLLEKELYYESKIISLNGDQLTPEFLEISPFHHVPIIIDNGFRVIESLAIIDYLETRYPTPSLLPQNIQVLAQVRMVQMVSFHELFRPIMNFLYTNPDSPEYQIARANIHRVLQLFSQLLADNSYFGGEQFTLGDIVAGTGISLLTKSDFSLQNYPIIQRWYELLMQRSSWQSTELTQREFTQFKRVFIKLKARERQRLLSTKAS
ncbi:glutathione S-transferase family protein [Calothrix sp. 336/3]|uniref:glutathione S-transferase family protein n=1 Tax=Calothrix sp. 336/3 TaxID=1337936 RepID=UPI0004E3336B|nr:glutathione S-transferase family protein [Calothrix sp. 336/3]AKG20039.1 glutathione transferase [Calothrix sp. 336/3]